MRITNKAIFFTLVSLDLCCPTVGFSLSMMSSTANGNANGNANGKKDTTTRNILNTKHKSNSIPTSSSTSKNNNNDKNINTINNISRRDALISASASIIGITTSPSESKAELLKADVVDLDAFKAAQAKTPPIPIPGTPSKASSRTTTGFITPIKDPNPLLSIKSGSSSSNKSSSTIKIPRIGYSLYKTSPDIAARSTALALRAGIKYFDVATIYNSNSYVAIPIKQYLDIGLHGIDYSNEKEDTLAFLDSIKLDGESHSLSTMNGSGSIQRSVAPPPTGSAGRRGRRETLFISHKLSNAEQSTKRIDIKRAIQTQITTLGTQYLDMVSIHSPLTNRNKRLESYAALLELRDAGFVKSVGVCNYGVDALNEIKEYGLDLPSMNQLELSPFNTHSDVVSWCSLNGIAIGCGAWSKLSGVDGPQDQWVVLSEIAKKKNMTKAQVLARWSLQKGYVCVPRSGAGSKLERLAIGENSYGGINNRLSLSTDDGMNLSILTDEEMTILDGLNVDYKAGKLGRRDGWDDQDVDGVDWDPTYFL